MLSKRSSTMTAPSAKRKKEEHDTPPAEGDTPPTMGSTATQPPDLNLFSIPNVLWGLIISFVARPTNRAPELGRSIALLSKDGRDVFKDQILVDDLLQNYNPQPPVARSSDLSRHAAPPAVQRSSPRLNQRVKGQSSLERLKECHLQFCRKTTFTQDQIVEMIVTKKLSKKPLLSLLDNFGQDGKLKASHINRRMQPGSTILVEVLSAPGVGQATILACTKLLVELGADVNLSAVEGDFSSMTPLFVAVSRGMHRVVKFLLEKKASTTTTNWGTIFVHRGNFTRYTDITVLQLAQAMHEAGSSSWEATDLANLNKCIGLLQNAAKEETQPEVVGTLGDGDDDEDDYFHPKKLGIGNCYKLAYGRVKDGWVPDHGEGAGGWQSQQIEEAFDRFENDPTSPGGVYCKLVQVCFRERVGGTVKHFSIHWVSMVEDGRLDLLRAIVEDERMKGRCDVQRTALKTLKALVQGREDEDVEREAAHVRAIIDLHNLE
ncbi:expressed unknown protein [Seminavis robusta]|uniref:Ankyrin n=1 Tax=Seminavis robusta TaxID=568900 RepID=A0A9N8DJL7_9STRA|nr:expressed unknown protein [Seminavis robusta]|eukprot:Sro117_g057480.1 n/a (490) ;mRNA; f:91668-93325